ncbi:hypothetical protein ABH941_007757 [Streptacidiphilus sp. EB103A]
MPFHANHGTPTSHYGQTWIFLAILGITLIIVFTLLGR